MGDEEVSRGPVINSDADLWRVMDRAGLALG